jgi:IS30 family transposase
MVAIIFGYGDSEIDTIIGENQKGAILTITERKTGFLLMEKWHLVNRQRDLQGLPYGCCLPTKTLFIP